MSRQSHQYDVIFIATCRQTRITHIVTLLMLHCNQLQKVDPYEVPRHYNKACDYVLQLCNFQNAMQIDKSKTLRLCCVLWLLASKITAHSVMHFLFCAMLRFTPQIMGSCTNQRFQTDILDFLVKICCVFASIASCLYLFFADEKVAPLFKTCNTWVRRGTSESENEPPAEELEKISDQSLAIVSSFLLISKHLYAAPMAACRWHAITTYSDEHTNCSSIHMCYVFS